MPLGAARFGLLGGVADLGKLELIETKNVSASSSAIFTSIQESTYNVHFLTTNDIEVGTDGADLYIRFFENGVEESGSVYQYAYQFGNASGSFGESKTTSSTFIRGSWAMGTAGNEVSNNQMYFYNLGDNTKYSFQTAHWTQLDSAGIYVFGFGAGVLPQASTVDQIKIYAETGTFSGTISLYGIAES